LTNVTLPFAIQIANLGWETALKQNPDLAKGLNTHAGKVTYKAVAEAHGYEFSPVL
jgi:alanine dehydrogenase